MTTAHLTRFASPALETWKNLVCLAADVCPDFICDPPKQLANQEQQNLFPAHQLSKQRPGEVRACSQGCCEDATGFPLVL